MYKCVEEYIDKLEWIREKTFEKHGNVEEYCSIAEEIPVVDVKKDRDRAVSLLRDIFEKYSWSEEFVTAFAAYCNFYILTGMHMCLKKTEDEKFGLEILYKEINDEEDVQYLEYIRKGIFEQELKLFQAAIDMNIYNFSIPWVYVYLFAIEVLIRYEKKTLDVSENKKRFLKVYDWMLEAQKNVSEELREYVDIKKIATNEVEELHSAQYIPCVYEVDVVHTLASCLVLELTEMKKISNKEELKTLEDIVDSMERIKIGGDVGNMWMYKEYFTDLFENINLLERISGDTRGFDFIEYDRDNTLVERSAFLKLPMRISPEGATRIDYARELKLRVEKEALIAKNRKMVEDYSHSIENIIKPSLINDIAEELLKDEKYVNLYKKLVQIYFSEVTTQNECRLLKMAHDFETTSGAIRENISRCKVQKTGEEKGVVSFEDLLYKAMNQVMMQIVEDKRRRMEFIREKMLESNLKIQLLDNCLWNKEQDVKVAFGFWKEFFNIDFNIEETLKDKYFSEKELGTTFLFTRMLELLTNLFTYGEYGERGEFVFSIRLEGAADEQQYIVFETSNTIGDRDFHSGGNGLIAMEEMLVRINNYNPCKDRFVEREEEGEKFSVRVYFDADLYI